MLKVGDTAPHFSLPDQFGKIRTNREFSTTGYILYFYPKDDTPGCTTEACSLRDNYHKFKQHNIPVIGVSADSVASHQKFAAKYNLPFILLSDTQKQLIKTYGTDGLILPKRATFVIGQDGTITHIYPKVSPPTHAGILLKDLGIE